MTKFVTEGKAWWWSCIQFYCLEVFQTTFILVNKIT